MFKFLSPNFNSPQKKNSPTELVSTIPSDIEQGRHDWCDLVDAIDAQCPSIETDNKLSEAELEASMETRDLFDASVPFPRDPSSLFLDSDKLKNITVCSYLAHKRDEWNNELYGREFIRQVDHSEQYHVIPVFAAEGTDELQRIMALPDSAPEGINFFNLLYKHSQVNNSSTNHISGVSTGDTVDNSGLLLKAGDDKPFSEYGEDVSVVSGWTVDEGEGEKEHVDQQHPLKVRKLERNEQCAILSPLERAERLKTIMKSHKTKKLNAMFSAQMYVDAGITQFKQPDFFPIILVSPNITAAIQITNVKAFLENGKYNVPQAAYLDPISGATSHTTRQKVAYVSATAFVDSNRHRCAFRNFEVYDNASLLAPHQWHQVVAAIVTEDAWHFENWFPRNPEMQQLSILFKYICGFLPFFEEDVFPKKINEWRVTPLKLTKKESQQELHIAQAYKFWETVFKFMNSCERFRDYVIGVEED